MKSPKAPLEDQERPRVQELLCVRGHAACQDITKIHGCIQAERRRTQTCRQRGLKLPGPKLKHSLRRTQGSRGTVQLGVFWHLIDRGIGHRGTSEKGHLMLIFIFKHLHTNKI